METDRKMYEKKISADAGRLADGERQPAAIDAAIAHERLEQLVSGKPEHYRQIIRLRLIGKNCAEIAAELHLDERTVRRILAKLRRTRQ
jgi:DNA-directed RNA polymerase specialized sigma24 family protein